jgi:hypothetical protein
MLRALTERLYFVKGKDGFVPCPKPTRSFAELRGFLLALVRAYPGEATVWTNEQFVQSYTGAKLVRYAQAVRTLAIHGVKRSYGYWSTFIKAEFYNATKKVDPCPRLIQPRSSMYNVLIGRYLKPAEKCIYKAIDRVFGHHVVLKCDNMWKRAATIKQYWGQFRIPCFVGLDASRFDQHVSSEALEFEHSLYNMLFKSEELAEYLKWQVNNVGFANMADGTIKYTVDGVRGSGDMNTALGNVVIMCALCHNYLSSMGVKYRFINDGDDCGVFIEADDVGKLDGLPAHHLGFGFEMTVEAPVYELEHVEFCQCHPIDCGGDNWMMVRNIHKCLEQDMMSHAVTDWNQYAINMCATGICGLALYEGMPVLDSYYRSFLKFTSKRTQVDKVLEQAWSGTGRTWRLFASQKRPFSIELATARASIWKAYGVLPDAQIELEARYRAFQVPHLNKQPLPFDSTSTYRYYH